MEIYNHIIREATSFADKDNILSIALNNIGYLYYRQKNYTKAKEYYIECLKYKKEEDMNYIDAMYELSLQCIQLGKSRKRLNGLKKASLLQGKMIDIKGCYIYY